MTTGAAAGGEMLQMRFHFGERDRDGGGRLDAAVMDACARRRLQAATLLRAVEGFGPRQLLRTDRLLSLSEDAPLVAVAVGGPAEVEGLVDEVRAIAADGLIVVEGVEVWTAGDAGDGEGTVTGTATASVADVPAPVIGGAGDEGAEGAGDSPEEPGDGAEKAEDRAAGSDVVKATVWGPRTGPAAPHLGAVAALRRHGVEAATVLLGVDGVLDGERRRARFVAANRGVPAMTVAVGGRAAIRAALAEADAAAHLVTVEGGVESYSRIAGVTLHTEARAERGVARKLLIEQLSLHGGAAVRVSLVTSEIASRGAHPAYLELIHALRRQGAAGATALRGVWGFRGAGQPHGDRVFALRRDVPIVVETVDSPDRAERWLELALALASEGDVVHVQPISTAITLR